MPGFVVDGPPVEFVDGRAPVDFADDPPVDSVDVELGFDSFAVVVLDVSAAFLSPDELVVSALLVPPDPSGVDEESPLAAWPAFEVLRLSVL